MSELTLAKPSMTPTAPDDSSPRSAERPCPPAWRVEVFRREEVDDPDGVEALAALAEIGVDGVRAARLGRGYLLPAELDRAQVARIVEELLADPVVDRARVTEPGARPDVPPGRARILVARKPGVMDPVALTVARAIARAGLAATGSTHGATPHVQSFRAWELEGDASRAELERCGRRVFANEVIDELHVDDEGLAWSPAAEPSRRADDAVAVPLRDADDARLEQLSREGELSLSLEEMRAIQAHFAELGREPTLVELETLAQTWSEHCKHKTFAGTIDMDGERIDNLFRETIQRATRELDRDWCVSVFHDNAGIVEFDRGTCLAFKVETHNHPSAIDPYGGAGTGIGGVIRDILGVGLGARPIANTDAFFVGPPDLPEDEVPRGAMHPRRILRGVVAGVRDYGNRMGIPTVNGGVWFDRGYTGNPLVYAGTLGILPRDCAEKAVAPGDVVVVVGGRTGRDGIHGATFSSVELHEESETVSSAAVQIGDPITEKRVLDALLVARDRRLYRGITDCGAGGLSSAVGEMGEDCGAEVDLERVPLKYPGLTAAEIWISEAQERMVLAVPPDDLEALLAVFVAEDVEATAIGRFTDTGRLVLRYDGAVVGDLDMRFLHDGTPRPVRTATWTAPATSDPGVPACDDVPATLLALLADPEVASKEWIVRQYDHEVQGAAVVHPLVGPRGDGPGNGSVLQPVAGSRRGAALACGANPRYGALDPEGMAMAVLDEALRNAVCVGGDPRRTAVLDNFSWGNCRRPEQLGALVLAARGCRDAALAYGTPFISGKDSLNNEYRVGDRTLSIPPTLLISALSIVPDVAHAVTMDLKEAGNLLYLVGATRAELGGSLYLRLAGVEGGRAPRPDLERAPALLAAVHGAIAAGLVRAAHDLSEGGLAVAAAEMAFAGELGAVLDLGRVPVEDPPGDDGGAPVDPTALRLFSESCTRFLLEVEPQHAPALERRIQGLPCAAVGHVTAEPRLGLRGPAGEVVADLAGADLRAAHAGPFATAERGRSAS